MSRADKSMLGMFVLAIAAMLMPGHAAYADEHIDSKVVATWTVDSSGIKEVKLMRFELAPGASLDVTVEGFEFCNATEGTWRLTNHKTGATTVYTAGSRWQMPPKGTEVTVSNPGNVPAVQYVYRVVGQSE